MGVPYHLKYKILNLQLALHVSEKLITNSKHIFWITKILNFDHFILHYNIDILSNKSSSLLFCCFKILKKGGIYFKVWKYFITI